MSITHSIGDGKLGIRVELDHDFRRITVHGRSDSYGRAVAMLSVLPPTNAGDYGDDAINAVYQLVLREAKENGSNSVDDPLAFERTFEATFRGGHLQVHFGPTGRTIEIQCLLDRSGGRIIELIEELVDLDTPMSGTNASISSYNDELIVLHSDLVDKITAVST